jgi:hypothetical protein
MAGAIRLEFEYDSHQWIKSAKRDLLFNFQVLLVGKFGLI